MKRRLLAAGFLTISWLWSSPVTAAVFSKIYAFGDSLSDNGNVFANTGWFPPPPYFQGHFSNGNVWVQNLAESLGVELFDAAFGGATTGDKNTLNGTFSGLLGIEQQINNFVASHSPMADPDALYTIWGGANDYLPTNSTTFVPFATPDTTLSNLKMAVNSLANIGARKLAILNLPNLGEVPRTRASLDGICPPNQQFDADCLNELTAAHNTGLASLIASLNPGLQITLVNINSFFNEAITNPGEFGFTFNRKKAPAITVLRLAVR